MKFQILLTALVLTPVATQAQQPASDPTEAYIAAGFAAMDTDKNGQVDRTEFEGFMRARLAKQHESFDTAFAQLDKNGDGKISRAEAAALPPLFSNFAAVDTNGDGNITKDELRAAMLKSQAQGAGGN